MKQLSYSLIEQSEKIQEWLTQFPSNREGAIEMLLRLKFIPSDDYRAWLQVELEHRLASPFAVFAVRKFPKSVKCIWDEDGETLPRPAESQGSEDLVQSVVANLKKNAKQSLLDHPSISALRESRIRDLVLIDDSIGSGSRVASYIKRMQKHTSFLSWWNFGWLKLHVISMARTAESENFIIDAIGGSNHHKRKFAVSDKIDFAGLHCYSRELARDRWGLGWQHIYDAARSCGAIPANRRLGYDETMSNFVFYHSVPNNLPGALWFDVQGWKPLFPQRTLPSWVVSLLNNDTQARPTSTEPQSNSESLAPEVIRILSIVKSGFRNESRIAWRVGLDRRVVVELLVKIRSRGFVTRDNRLTEAGFLYLKRYNATNQLPVKQKELYIPKSWCAGRETIQPFGLESASLRDRAEFVAGSPAADGEVGQTSLERTDAKTAQPSLDVMTELPAATGNGHDIHGPRG